QERLAQAARDKDVALRELRRG
ncbi:MAG: hypothetical protein JWM62_2845, partial [Frankiales bacterium]|nr:hypothetical protein [Frankiales bacterium]